MGRPKKPTNHDPSLQAMVVQEAGKLPAPEPVTPFVVYIDYSDLGQGNNQFDTAWHAPFLEELIRQHGNITKAAKVCGITHSQVFYHFRHFPQLHEITKDIRAAVKDEHKQNLKEMAYALAMGQDVDGNPFKNAKGEALPPNTVMIIFLLKAAEPETYRDIYNPPKEKDDPLAHLKNVTDLTILPNKDLSESIAKLKRQQSQQGTN